MRLLPGRDVAVYWSLDGQNETPIMLALEPRIMFDGAMAGDAVDAVDAAVPEENASLQNTAVNDREHAEKESSRKSILLLVSGSTSISYELTVWKLIMMMIRRQMPVSGRMDRHIPMKRVPMDYHIMFQELAM